MARTVTSEYQRIYFAGENQPVRPTGGETDPRHVPPNWAAEKPEPPSDLKLFVSDRIAQWVNLDFTHATLWGPVYELAAFDAISALLALDVRIPYGPTREDYLAQRLDEQPHALFVLGDIKDVGGWRQYPWNNPPESGGPPDPNADRKPTWDEVLKGWRIHLLNLAAWRESEQSDAVETLSTAVATTPVSHEHAREKIHVGGGIDHMAAMMKHAADATRAGQRWPVAILRDVGGNELRLHTDVEAEQILDPVPRNKNRSESAKNRVQGVADKLLATIRDPNGGLTADADDELKLAAREKAADDYGRMITNLDRLYANALAEVDALGDWPSPGTPLARLKRIIIRWIEGAATAKINEILNAAGQQGMDLVGSCRDQSDALEKVSNTKQSHQILIERADDADDVKFKYSQAVTAINSITPVRTPIWYDGRGKRIDGPTFEIAAVSAFVQARSPVEGKVSGQAQIIPIDTTTPANPHATAQLEKAGNNMQFRLGIIEGTAPARYELTSRNICGPTRLIVTLTPPPE